MFSRKWVLFAMASLVTVSLAWAAGPRDALWKDVDDASKKGLPKTAIDKLNPIIEQAIKEKAYAEAVKAIGKKIALEGNIQGNKPEEKITRMRAEIDRSPAEMKPVLEAIQANWYWHYYQQNRWRFMRRTQTSAPPGDDFTTWDLARLFAEIDRQFDRALAAADVLKKTPIGEYDVLLAKGNASDAYRPTLYDFLVYNAIEFYATGEQAGARAEDAFDLAAGSPIFGTADEFAAWNPETTDESSPTLKAIRLYQQLLQFHKADDDRSAYLDADLARLEFGYNKAFGEEKNARYKAALKRFADQHANHEISSRALHLWASVVHGEGEWADAHQLAKQGETRFPDSVGGRRCFNLIQQIEAKECQVYTERVWTKPWPTIDISYRNIRKLHFRVVAFDFESFVRENRSQPEQVDEKQRRALLTAEPVKAWSVDLPATDDYQFRVESVPALQDLKPGSYFLIASQQASFAETNNQVLLTEFWVSDLALVMRNRQSLGALEGFVLSADTGEPIAGAAVRAWLRTNNRTLVPLEATKSDANGLFRFNGANNGALIVHATHGGQSLSTWHQYYVYSGGGVHRTNERTMFFTDRALYRPGQTIQYKGICITSNAGDNTYQVIKSREVTVVFQDGNGKEISRQKLRTNDYGSFSGSVTAPRDRLMGQMVLRVDVGPAGTSFVRVEEYKRPKFQVAVEAPKEAPKLNGEVKVVGKATAYTGAAIDGAKVRWRVVREVRYPIWWYWRCWWMPAVGTGGAEIAHGSSVTRTDGTFDVVFNARPDSSVSEDSEPTFRYTVYADVVDTTGETRSANRVVNVGYTALAATLTAEDWQTNDKPVELSVRTTTLDGEGQSASATLKVYRVEQPKSVQRPVLASRPRPVNWQRNLSAQKEPPKPDPTNPNSWPLGDVVFEKTDETDASGNARVFLKLDAGLYRAKLETRDRFGKTVTAEFPFRVLEPTAGKLALKVPNLVAAPKWSLEPGEEFQAVWGSGYEKARAFIEIEHRHQVKQSFWTELGATQQTVKQKIDEALRGGFTLRVTMVRENRAYLESRRVEVPWTNKQLTVKWEHFVSKLEPGQKETWTAVISGSDSKKAAAELVAALYDASLDAYQPHNWPNGFGVFYTDNSYVNSQFENQLKWLGPVVYLQSSPRKDESLSYRQFPADIIQNFYGYALFGGMNRGRAAAAGGAMPPGAPMESLREMQSDRRAMDAADKNALADGANAAKRAAPRDEQAPGQAPGGGSAQPDLANVAARQNLNETAFFFPQLIADADGVVKMQFTMPESLTQWKFLGYAHDASLRAGLLTDKVVTAKDLMIQPNPPRFVREGDSLEFTVKVSNQSPTRQTGKVRLTLADARTGSSVDAQLGNAQLDQSFDIPSGESKSFSWKLNVPDGLGFLTYKAVGSTGRLSDGEEGYLPVLVRRVLVTESLPLPIRGAETKNFDFARLSQSGKSDSLRHQSVTVQMVSNPSWYAVMALPYLMESPHECTEQTFNRLYANSLARHIAASDPKIRRVFDTWKAEGGNTLDSPLEKNQDLKNVLIEETPWLRQAQAESQARRNVGILFDENRLNQESAALLRKLADQQYESGMWPWFPGGLPNEYITLYITTGFGRMRRLGVPVDVAPAVKSLRRLDGWMTEIYQRIPADRRDKNNLSTLIALYLYGRSFFLEDQAVAPEHKEAVNYWLEQARTHWLELGVRQSQAHLAIALKRFGQLDAAKGIMASIKERSVSDAELGMFWRDLELSWWWYRAPIETQAMMIEAFDEVMGDAQAVEDCKVWLLKQKQTQDWKTTKATADAVYALLLRGANVLASDALVEVSLGGQKIVPEKVEAGTGFFEQRFTRGEITPKLGAISVKKVDAGVAWGSVHWQYLEDMSKVTAYDGTPLKLTKQLYVKTPSAKGPVLTPVAGPVDVGDEVVVRLVLRTDRDMEYVHLKDHRGSGTEPVNVLSQYKVQDGLHYYESTRDTASHFYIDYLPKGTYVFEYSVRVQLRGKYQSGFAAIQCMYAPEFNSHSESLWIEAK